MDAARIPHRVGIRRNPVSFRIVALDLGDVWCAHPSDAMSDTSAAIARRGVSVESHPDETR